MMCLCGSQPSYVWLANLRTCTSTGLLASWEGSLPWKVPEHASLYAPLHSKREIETLPTTIVLDWFSTSLNWVFTNCNWPRTNSQNGRKSYFHNLHLHKTQRISAKITDIGEKSCFLEFWFCHWKCCVSDTRIHQFVIKMFWHRGGIMIRISKIKTF